MPWTPFPHVQIVVFLNQNSKLALIFEDDLVEGWKQPMDIFPNILMYQAQGLGPGKGPGSSINAYFTLNTFK